MKHNLITPDTINQILNELRKKVGIYTSETIKGLKTFEQMPLFDGKPIVESQNGTSYLMVYGTGTPEDNEAEIEAAFEEAVLKTIVKDTVVSFSPSAESDIRFEITAISKLIIGESVIVGGGQTGIVSGIGGPIVYIHYSDSGTRDYVLSSISAGYDIVPVTPRLNKIALIVAPGDYGNPTIEETDGISIVSLTGKNDVILDGVASFGITEFEDNITIPDGTLDTHAVNLKQLRGATNMLSFNPNNETHTTQNVLDWLSIHGNLRNAFIRDVTFSEVDFSNVDFSGSTFSSVEFRGCNLSGASFKHASFLSATHFIALDLYSTDFDYAMFDGESGFYGYSNVAMENFESATAKLMYYGEPNMGDYFDPSWLQGVNTDSFIYFNAGHERVDRLWDGNSWEFVE